MWNTSWSIGYFEVQRKIMQITDRYMTVGRAYFVRFMVIEEYTYKETEKCN